MDKEQLWDHWADPSDWCEYREDFETLEETKKRFFEDLDAWFLDKRQREFEETTANLMDHIKRTEESELTKAWEMDPKDLKEQIQKQLKSLKSIKL